MPLPPTARTPDPAAAPGAVVVFEIARHRYALPAEALREVAAGRPVTPLPFAPPGLAGLVNLHGRVVTLLDPRPRLGLPPAAATAPWQLLAATAEAVALRVDRVVSMTTLTAAAAPPAAEEPAAVTGLATFRNRPLRLLDLALLGLAELVPATPPEGEVVAAEATEGVVAAAPAATGPRCLLLEAGGGRYALPLALVEEVAEVGALLPLPQVAGDDAVAGLVPLRGRPLPALLLARLLGTEPVRPTLALVALRLAEGRIGLLVERLLRIERPAAAEQIAADGAITALLRDRSGALVGLLDPTVLIAAETLARFRHYLAEETAPRHTRPEERRRLLTFEVGASGWAVALEAVERVEEFRPGAALPQREGGEVASAAVHVGGEVAPVVDLRRRFAAPCRVDDLTAYVVVRHRGAPWALVVDRVARVVELAAAAIAPLGGGDGPVAALAHLPGATLPLLDLDRLLA